MNRNSTHRTPRLPVRWQRYATPAFVMLLGLTASVPATAASNKPAKNAAAKAKAKTKAVPANFSIKFLGNERSVTAGAMTSYTFTVSSAGGQSSKITYDIPDLPSDVTSKITNTAGRTYRLDVTTATSARAGTAVYAVRGRLGKRTQTAAFRLSVLPSTSVTLPPTATPTPPPVVGDYLVTLESPTLTLSPGNTGALTVNVTRREGFTAPVTFKVEGLPANIDAAFSPNPTQTSAKLTITPQSNANSATYLLVITGTSGTLSRAVAARLNVRRVGPFTMSVAPAALSTPQGIDASTTLSISAPAGQTQVPDVSIEISGAPSGVSVLTPTTSGPTTTLILSTNSTTPPGVYNLNLTGRSGTHTQTAVLQLTVTSNVPGFGISAQPATQTTPRGSTATYNVTTSTTGGFNGQIAYSVNGLPNNSTAIFEPSPTGVTVKIATTAATTPTTYTVQITGKNGNLTATIPVELVVTAPAM